VAALNQVYFGVLWFMAGQVAPTALLPGPLQTAARVLPFRYMVAFPVELLLGRSDAPQIVQSFAMQLLWLLLAFGGYHLLWRVGLRHYSAVGG
jgi:ABC-2 type transport system permease protein